MSRTVILGAGITGLTAGYDTFSEIYEALDVPGGLCRTQRMKGWMFDWGGGHWIFPPKENVVIFKQFIDSLGIHFNTYEKKQGVYFDTIIDGSIQDYASKPANAIDSSMKCWLLEKFGIELSNLFFFPFNDNYTNGLYETCLPDNLYKNPSKIVSYNDFFGYPWNGLDALVNKLAEKCKIRYNKKVVSIDTKNKAILFEDKDYTCYDKLISTIPLSHLLEMIGADHSLPHTSTTVFNIGASKGENFPKHHWLYFPYSKSGFYRVGFYSNVDPMFAPNDMCSIYVESSNDKIIFKDVLKELIDKKIIGMGYVASINHIPVSYTYQDNESNVQNYLDQLKKLDILSTGRYGKWKFQGIADSITDGLGAKNES